MPWLEDLHLRHHTIGEDRRWREMRQFLEGDCNFPSVIDLGEALRTLTDMRTQRRDAEANVAVDEQIDFVWEKMAMIHTITSEAPYGRLVNPVSGNVPRLA